MRAMLARLEHGTVGCRLSEDGRDQRRGDRERNRCADCGDGEGAGEVVAAEAGRDRAGPRGARAPGEMGDARPAPLTTVKFCTDPSAALPGPSSPAPTTTAHP